MVLKCDPVFSAVESINKLDNSINVILTPQGKVFNHDVACEFSNKDQVIMICGHYEGFDERIKEGIDSVEISIGDFILTGGEIGAIAIIDAVSRLISGVLGKDESSFYESFSSGLLEYPQYTRPSEYRGMKVPDILLSGNHKEIAKWRKTQEIMRTYKKRPDLYKKFIEKGLSKEDKQIIHENIGE